MLTMFLICSIVGGTVLAFQVTMQLIGLGAQDIDFAEDVGFETDGLDVSDGIDLGDLGDGADAGEAGATAAMADSNSTSFFGVLSFRTVVAAITFFGLTGWTALQAGQPQPTALIFALAAGAAGMFGVHWLMQQMFKLRHDGTVRIKQSIGEPATVYIPIPANRAGIGKVQLNLQNRLMEYAAMTTDQERLATGTRVMVVDVINANTLAVEPAFEAVGSN